MSYYPYVKKEDMKLNVYVGMRKTLNKNKKKIILEMKKNKQTNKQKPKNLRVFLSENWI